MTVLVELRNDHVMIDGYVNAVCRDSRRLTDRDGVQFVEQVEVGAFQRAIDKAVRIDIKANHQRVIGGTGDNLELEEDAIGLRAHATITDPEVMEAARAHELKGWSFGFMNPIDEREPLPDGTYRRHIKDLDLLEVSIIYGNYTPAYFGTSVEARAEEEVQCSDIPEIRAVYLDNTVETPKEPIDYTYYHECIEALERGTK